MGSICSAPALARQRTGGVSVPFWPACTIFMAEVMSAETSVMLLGTTSVVVASEATRL